jgi:predicted amidophosphoribosyltransferase
MGLLSLVLPLRCAGCDRPGAALCDPCVASFTRLGPTGCERCGAPGAWPVRRCAECAGRRLGFATARAAIAYDARARPVVSAWKERGRGDLTRPLAAIVTDVVPRPVVDALTFVPGDHERGLARGHVPAEGLARAVGRAWGLPVERLLVRVGRRESTRQASLARAGRGATVRGAFAATGPAPRRVALVDDVYTTGATVGACATELRRAGARWVEIVTLARAVR